MKPITADDNCYCLPDCNYREGTYCGFHEESLAYDETVERFVKLWGCQEPRTERDEMG
jgi:hypothetical protein